MDEAAGSVPSIDVLLDAVAVFLRRFISMSESQATTLALFVVHTHAIHAAHATPYISVSSAVWRSGKTRLLEVLELLVREPLRSVNMSEAALFRSLETEPTLLFDEVDAIFGPKARDREDLRALLNAGYTRGTPVFRCVGEGTRQRVEPFAVFGPKVLTGIGRLPDTIRDRTISIRLKRRLRTEQIERLRLRAVRVEAEPLRVEIATWAGAHMDALAVAEPQLPDELDDRAQDVCEPLLAVADFAGGEWPERARQALIALRGGADEDDELGIRLLADCKKAFGDDDRMATASLLKELRRDEIAPWATYAEKGLSARGLATLLRRFEIEPKQIRISENKTLKGYLRESFEDAWNRYIPPDNAREKETSETFAQPRRSRADSKGKREASVSFLEWGANPDERRDVSDVSLLHGEPEATAAENGHPQIGDEGFTEFLKGAYLAGHVTHDEVLERLRVHGLLMRAEHRAKREA
jgi:hypothetical protein